MLKIAKNGLILHMGSFGFSHFFRKSPPPIRLRPRRGPTGTENFESQPIKNLEKKPWLDCWNVLFHAWLLNFYHVCAMKQEM